MFAQAPTIVADNLMLCPHTEGTATISNNQVYSTYQWYYKYWFLEDAYAAIPNATSSSFTYDWNTYDQALLKVEITLNGQTYESNVLQVDSWAWSGLSIGAQWPDSAMMDFETGITTICNGDTASFTLGIPYTENIKWFKDGVSMTQFENQTTLVVSEAGSYTVQAAPDVCTNSSSNNFGLPIVIGYRNCELSTTPNEFDQKVKIYPNPTSDFLNIDSQFTTALNYKVYDLKGSLLTQGVLESANSRVNLSAYQSGTYMVTLNNNESSKSFKIVKN